MPDKAAEALIKDDPAFRSVVISDPWQPDCPIVYVSEEFERQTGYSAADAVGRNCRFLQGPGTDPAAIAAIRAAMEAATELTIDLLNYRKDGTPFWNRLRLKPLFDANGRLQYFAGAQNPIPESEVRRLPIEAVFD